MILKGWVGLYGEFCSFVIINDGSPVDIALSHGSVGSAPGKGEISVRFNQVSVLRRSHGAF